MRTWFWTLIVLVLAVVLALLLREHGGNVLIMAQPWRIELSLAFAVVLLIFSFVLLYWIVRVLSWTGSSPDRFRSWRGRRAQKRDLDLLEKGWINVLDGRYIQAEKELLALLTKTRSADRKVLAGLSAARAQHLMGYYDRRDQTLKQAHDSAGSDTRLSHAVQVVTAEMLLDQNRPAEALTLLKPLQDASSRYFHAGRLLLRAERLLGHYDQVYDLTRLLLRRSAIDKPQARRFIREATVARLARCDEAGFKTIWGDLNNDERTDPGIALAAAQVLHRQGRHADEARTIEAALNRGMDDPLLRAYALCEPDQAVNRLGHAELWLKSHPDHPGLLATLGQLCLGAQLWGQGEHYLERSMKLRSDMRVQALLGNLNDSLGRPDRAMQHWRLACAAAGAMPALAVDRLLPAADTRGDPHFVDDDAAGNRTAAQGPTIPEAASAVYAGDEGDALGSALPASPPAPGAASPDQSESDEYYDSAPIPGVDMSQTSDGSRHGPDRR
ncbi:MAG: heme biosynthesis protein HemY [Alcaligenaceae bacterium]|nr:heme biosynthesis protein HemY [Alcaligenaceae bacterium]